MPDPPDAIVRAEGESLIYDIRRSSPRHTTINKATSIPQSAVSQELEAWRREWSATDYLTAARADPKGLTMANLFAGGGL